MTELASPPRPFDGPLAWVGRATLDAAAYLGGMAVLPAFAVRSVLDRRRPADAADGLGAQLAWMFGIGFPLVGLMHVGIGSFLSMQSYFGGTFADGTGAVVGVGLLRNVAPLLSGLTLAWMVAARTTPELRARRSPVRENAPDASGPTVAIHGFLARTAPDAPPREAGPAPAPLEAPAIASRILAAVIAGPVLGVWASAVGTVVGWQVAQTLMGVSTHNYFQMFWEMLWVRDLTGVLAKGLLYGLFAGVCACHEGLRGRADAGLAELSSAACRAACFASVAILIVNSAYFILAYHAGPAFGPTLLEPPSL
jgi:phospholipid/cholesterol/gamma-HCH transport system permease protein